jgi:formyltetrahydrofolate synthetase
VIDVNDRMLRNIVAGLGRRQDGIPRQTGFDNTAASEVMAIVGLSSGYADMRARLGRIVVGLTHEGNPVTAEDLRAAGAMGAILRDALKPNLMQTIEHTPCLVHTGPFANIAHGNSSILADLIGLRFADYVVTESGFGADMGAEKLFNIKCRASGLVPDAVGLVATVRALKMHGAGVHIRTGLPVDASLAGRDGKALRKGFANLEKHIENVRLHGLPVVVIVNRFSGDPEDELEETVRAARDLGADDAAVSDAHAKGGEGAMSVADALRRACDRPRDFRFLYPDDASIKEKIETVATRIYGADGVDYSPEAEREIRRFTNHGFDRLPICVAKTQFSLSHDPLLKGRPRGFRLPIRDIRAAVGAGFLYPLAGEIQTMPGLPTQPGGEAVDLTPDGRITGLF